MSAQESHHDWILQHSENFDEDLNDWVVEQQPGGTVSIRDGALVIEDKGGCTVWFGEKLKAPVRITYEVTVSSDARVSDMNCFWLASDPDHPNDLFFEENDREGAFAQYDRLELYYVGYGGNDNSTTRFRRYLGDGEKPLLQEYDLQDEPNLLKADHPYKIELIAAEGRAIYRRDGETIFEYDDPDPLKEGWFGFRTVLSKLEIRSFRVWGKVIEQK